jgi:hypothetical protein
MSVAAYLTVSARPYPGLRSFESHEADIFFGREAQVDQILAKLAERWFLALVGTSGCGKSSLSKAGLIPALGMGLIAEAGHRWRVATLKPGESPLHNLAHALLQPGVLGPAPERDDLRPDSDLLDFVGAGLRRGPLGLVEVLSDALTPGAGPALPPGHNLMLLVDQFEEIFRYRRVGDSKEADAFVALLLATVRQTDVPVYVVVTMRSDYLGDCAVFEGLPEMLNESQFLTPRLTRAQRQEAIEGPARVFGGEVEPALVNRLLNDMTPDPDQLPLMQHVLTRLWAMAEAKTGDGPATLRLKDYRDIGGVERALHLHAEEVFKQRLTGPQQQTAEILFRCLVERETEYRDIRRPTLLRDVASMARVSEAEVAAVVEVFREPDLRFLTPPAPEPLGGSTILDVTHESLIRRWHRLQQWVDDEQELARTYLRYVHSARLWGRKKTGLLVPPELEFAVKWLRSPLTTAAWARRYGGDDFALATQYIETSEDQALREQEQEKARLLASQEAEKQALIEQEKARYERELRKLEELEEQLEEQRRKEREARRWIRWATGAFVVTLSLAVWALWERSSAVQARTAAEKERDQLRDVVEEIRSGVSQSMLEVPKEVERQVDAVLQPQPQVLKMFQLLGLGPSFVEGLTRKISHAVQQSVLKIAIPRYTKILNTYANLQIRGDRGTLYLELGRAQCWPPRSEAAEPPGIIEAEKNFLLAVADHREVFEKEPDRKQREGKESRRDLSRSYTDLALAQAAQGRSADAAATEAARAALWPDPVEERLEQAREWASWLPARGPGDADLAVRAVAALREAIDRGLRDAKALDDPDFDRLRMRDDFQQLQRRLAP